MLDLQQHMVLVLRTDRGAKLWLTAGQGANPLRWHDLRRT